MHTIRGAYMQFSEKQKGSIEPGKLADMVVIDRDFLTVPEDQIQYPAADDDCGRQDGIRAMNRALRGATILTRTAAKHVRYFR